MSATRESLLEMILQCEDQINRGLGDQILLNEKLEFLRKKLEETNQVLSENRVLKG